MYFASQKPAAMTYPSYYLLNWIGGVFPLYRLSVSMWLTEHSSWVRKRSRNLAGSTTNNSDFSVIWSALCGFDQVAKIMALTSLLNARFIVQNIPNSLMGYAKRIGYFMYNQSAAIYHHSLNTINVFLSVFSYRTFKAWFIFKTILPLPKFNCPLLQCW